jgi:hypothetical protein
MNWFYLNRTKRGLMTTFQIVIIAVYTAMTFALQVVLAPIPNVELVTLMLSLAAMMFPWPSAVLISLSFSGIEVLFYGVGQWVILYLFVWNWLVFIILIFKKIIKKHWWVIIIIDGLFGITFGMYDSTIFYLINGFNFAASIVYWTKGIVFDVIHCISNATVAALLYKVLYNTWQKNFSKYIS